MGAPDKGVKRPGRGVDNPPPSTAEVKRVELYLYSPFGPSWPVLGRTLPFFSDHLREQGIDERIILKCIFRE
jgi:hypothetical protein